MLTEGQAAVLLGEVRKPEYDGKTAEQAHAYLFDYRTLDAARPTGLRLTPLAAARLFGATKAERVAAAVKQAYPVTADFLFSEGLDPTSAEVKAFLCLVAATFIKSEDPATANHADRLSWANGMLSGDLDGVKRRVRAHLRNGIATNATFQSAGLTIDDAAVQFIVDSQVNFLVNV